MGLPVARLVVGSNRNDILARFLAANDMTCARWSRACRPSMDIQVSSNFERLLFELLGPRRRAHRGSDGGIPRPAGGCRCPPRRGGGRADRFRGFRLDDAGTLAEIRRLHAACGYLADPHTAIGIAAARAAALPPGVPMVAMATAHPAKFPDAIEQAIGRRPPLPAAPRRPI